MKQSQKIVASELASLKSLLSINDITAQDALRIINHYKAISKMCSEAGPMTGKQLQKALQADADNASLECNSLLGCQVAPSKYSLGHAILIF